MEQSPGNRRRRRLLVTALITGALALGGRMITYHDRGPFPVRPVESIRPEEVVLAARGISGTLYDYWKGGHKDLGGRLGFVVCVDVPRFAYAKAGFSWREAMTAHYRTAPEVYAGADDTPENPYFDRRSRNLQRYCRAVGKLISPAERPAPADVVFYGTSVDGLSTHTALVTRLTDDGHYFVFESAPETILAGEVRDDNPTHRGLVVQGFGRILPSRSK